MSLVILSVVVASLLIQVPNLMGVSVENELSLIQVIRISFITLPITFLASAAYIIFYGKGVSYLSYPSLMMIGKFVGFFVALSFQYLFFKKNIIGSVEIVGIIISLVGTVIMVYHNEIGDFLVSARI